jgi:kinesin family protein 15
MAQEEASRRQEHLTINCKCSFLEIYNEQISDLLDPTSTNLQVHFLLPYRTWLATILDIWSQIYNYVTVKSIKWLAVLIFIWQIHEDPKRGLFVENLKEMEVRNVGDVMELLRQV